MNAKPKGALILTHLQTEGSSTIGKVLHDRGFRVKTRSVPRIDLNEIDPLRPDLLVFMGGPIGVYQAEDYPFLTQEIDIARKRLQADLPTIGVCLGSQIMAAALGANVYPGDAGQEIGWARLTVTDTAKETSFRHLDGTQTNMFHWHGDTFDLPEGATRLASSEKYENQIFTYGQNGLGLQCHPEVRRDQLQEMFVMFTTEITGDNAQANIHELRAQTQEHIETLKTQADKFFNEWLDNRGL